MQIEIHIGCWMLQAITSLSDIFVPCPILEVPPVELGET